MPALSDSEILSLWESGARRHPLDRALLMLGAAETDTPYERLADWPLGRRNQAVARLRRSCFGDAVRAWLACRACAEKLEFELDSRLLADDAAATDGAGDEPVVVNGRSFRAPTSRDLAQAARESDPLQAAIRLAGSCCLSVPAPADWPAEELDDIGRALALADPHAEIRLPLQCPACGHAWEESLDIAWFTWEEIEARARRLLFDVHTLASAYGWSEAEILTLGASRRARYVELVQT
jgi:hypothetical protein